jgi:hypothetical protein
MSYRLQPKKLSRYQRQLNASRSRQLGKVFERHNLDTVLGAQDGAAGIDNQATLQSFERRGGAQLPPSAFGKAAARRGVDCDEVPATGKQKIDLARHAGEGRPIIYLVAVDTLQLF